MARRVSISILACAVAACVPVSPADKCSVPAIQRALVENLIDDALARFPGKFDGPLPSDATLAAEGARLIRAHLFQFKLITAAAVDKDTGNVACAAELGFHLTDDDAALVKAAAARGDPTEPGDIKEPVALTNANGDLPDIRYSVIRDLESNSDRVSQVFGAEQAEAVVSYIVAQRLHQQIRRNLFNQPPGPQLVPAPPPANPAPRSRFPRHWVNVGRGQQQFPYPVVTPTPDLDVDR